MEKDCNNCINQIEVLEKQLSILKKSLERSELNRKLIEKAKDHYDQVYRSSIDKLAEQKRLLDRRNQELDMIRQELLVKNMELLEASTTDGLTRINNRSKINDVLNQEYTRANRYKTLLTVVIVDVDEFKLVNDNYGHQIGYRVLVDLAQLMKHNIRECDDVGRWGGEEFFLVLPYCSAKDALKLVERFQLKVAEHNFRPVPKLTCSFGISEYNEGDIMEDIIKNADAALYHSKKKRDSVSVFMNGFCENLTR